MDEVAQLYPTKLFLEIITYNASKPYFILYIINLWDTWLSPSHLERWKLTPEASCFLCNKDTCTTSHILGTCKIALSQGRFFFCHDNVLKTVISNIISSIKNIKSSVPTSKQPIKIKFVTKGARVKNKISSPSWDITSSITDRFLLRDLCGTFSFPPHKAFTELRPDITMKGGNMVVNSHHESLDKKSLNSS